MSDLQSDNDVRGARNPRVGSQARHAALATVADTWDTAAPTAPASSSGLQSLLKSLNDALTAELVCAFRRRDSHHWSAESGTAATSESAARCHADFERADRLAERIVQLGGHPEFALDVLDVHVYGEANFHTPLDRRLSLDLAAEQVAARLHQELIVRLGTSDPGTSGLLHEFLLSDAEHIDALSKLRRSPQRKQRNYPIKYARSTSGVSSD